ncbi:MAG: hypothetical protein ACRC1H_02880, partial [Caldilineaceae bacterium]
MALLFALMAILVVGRPAHAQSDQHVNDDSIDRPVLYMKFDETSGSITRNFPNTAITATLSSGAQFSTTLPTAFTPPNFRTLLHDGSDDLVMIDDNPTTSFLSAIDNSFTIAAWVKRTRLNGGIDTVYVNGTLPNAWHLAIMTGTVQTQFHHL